MLDADINHLAVFVQITLGTVIPSLFRWQQMRPVHLKKSPASQEGTHTKAHKGICTRVQGGLKILLALMDFLMVAQIGLAREVLVTL